MDTSKHTPMISPLPWEGGTCHITDATGETVAQCFRSPSGDKQANAAFIVRAANSHDQLVAALKEIIESANACDQGDAEAWAQELYQCRRTARDALAAAEA